MDVSFADPLLERLYRWKSCPTGYSDAVIKAYRDAVQFIAAARDEQDLRSWQSLHLATLSGDRAHQWTIHLHGEWQLILEKKEAQGGTAILVIAIEDSASLFTQVVR
jgi:plasmid maintenance system killer protein